MALFTLDEFENIVSDQKKINTNENFQRLINAGLMPAQSSTLPTATPQKSTRNTGKATRQQQQLNRRLNSVAKNKKNSSSDLLINPNDEPVDYSKIHKKNAPTIDTEKLKKDLGADYELFASQGISGGNNPEYIGALGENFLIGVKNVGRNIANAVDSVKTTNTKEQRLIQAIDRVRAENPTNQSIEKGIQQAVNNVNPYTVQRQREQESIKKATERRQRTRQETANNDKFYGNLPGYGAVKLVGQGVGALAPTIAVNAVAPGAGSAIFATNVYGRAFTEAVGDGATYKQAKQYARLDTALEFATEHLFGGIKNVTPEGSVAGNILNKLDWRNMSDKFVKTDVGRYLFKKVLDITGEGAEEVISEVVTPFLKRAVYNPNTELADLSDILSAFGGGALVAAVLGAINAPNEFREINNDYYYSKYSADGTSASDMSDVKQWFDGIDDLESARAKYREYVKAYSDVRNSAEADPARAAELASITNGYNTLKTILKNNGASTATASAQATETATEQPQAKNQVNLLSQGLNGENSEISRVDVNIRPTSENAANVLPSVAELERTITNNGVNISPAELDRILGRNTTPAREVSPDISRLEQAAVDSGIKATAEEVRNIRTAEPAQTKKSIVPKTKWKDRLNEILSSDDTNKANQLEQLKDSVKSTPAKNAIQAEIDKIKPKDVTAKEQPKKQVNKEALEKRFKAAQSEENTNGRAAARRLLAKQGIDWQTGEEMPVKLTAAQVNKIREIADKNRNKNYTLFSNNDTEYYQDEVLYPLSPDGKIKKALTFAQTGKILNDPSTVKVATVNYNESVVPDGRTVSDIKARNKVRTTEPSVNTKFDTTDLSKMSDERLQKADNRFKAETEKVKDNLAELSKQKSVSASEMPKEFYREQEKLTELRNSHRDVTDEISKRKSEKAKAEKKPFVNSFGEATKREITTSTYKRREKRNQKEIERRLSHYPDDHRDIVITEPPKIEKLPVTKDDITDIQIEALKKAIERAPKYGRVILKNVKAIKQPNGTTYLMYKNNKGDVLAIEPDSGKVFSFDTIRVSATEGTSGADYWRNGTVIGKYQDIINSKPQAQIAPTKAESVDTEKDIEYDEWDGNALVKDAEREYPTVKDSATRAARLLNYLVDNGKLSTTTKDEWIKILFDYHFLVDDGEAYSLNNFLSHYDERYVSQNEKKIFDTIADILPDRLDKGTFIDLSKYGLGLKAKQSTGSKSVNNRLVQKLSAAIPELKKNKSVVSLTGNEFPKGKIDLVTQVGNYFKSIGGKVTRKNFGDIIIDSNTVKDDMAHGIGRAKSVTFKAVPAVLENGVQIDYQKDWKGRGKDSYVFAAPIDIGSEKAYVCAVVLRDKDQRFYLHEVVNDKGERLYLANKKEPDTFKTGDSQQSGVSRVSNSSKQIVTHPTAESQEKTVENSEINVSERKNEVEKLQSLESEESIQADIQRIDAENKNLEKELENSTDEPDTDESITAPTATRATRYEIDEKKARTARELRSMRGYKAGEATSEYNEYLTKAEEIAKAAKEKNPAESERIDYLLNKYSQKIAQNINAVSANESKYPAWFISGPARYNVKKNEALVRRTMDLFNQRESYDKILYKIQRIGNGTEAIQANDKKALEKLTKKLETQKQIHSQSKLANAYYRKNGNLDGFHPVGLTEEREKGIFERAQWMKEHYPDVKTLFDLTNSNAEIHRLESRIKTLSAIKENGNTEVANNSSYRVVENSDIMRVQYFFNEKPSEEIRNALKKNGFVWSPKNNAWQRRLAGDYKYAENAVNKVLDEHYGKAETKEEEKATDNSSDIVLKATIPGGNRLESLINQLAKSKEQSSNIEKNIDDMSIEELARELAESREVINDIIENKDEPKVIKEKLEKHRYKATPQIITKIQSFYGYEGTLPESMTDNEDGILFRTEEPLKPQGRNVKLTRKETKRYNDATEFYGEVQEKKGGAREVQIPKSVEFDENDNLSEEEHKFVSESAKTMAQSPAFSDEYAETMKKAVLDGVFSYEKQGNQKTLDKATEKIEELGFSGAYNHWNKVVEGKSTYQLEDFALGVKLMQNAAENNDIKRAVEIASGLQMFSTLGAQTVQFGNVWRKLTPEGRLYTVQMTVNHINRQQAKYVNKTVQELADESNNNGKKKGKNKPVTVPPELLEKLMNAGNDLKERERIMEEIEQNIADRLPGTWDEKLRSLRYLGMLGNPRTHIRNITGNILMIAPSFAKNEIGALLEIAIPKEERTKAGLGKLRKTKSKERQEFINAEFDRYKDMITGNKKYDFKGGIQGKRTIFKTIKPLNTLSKFNSDMLEKEDERFLKFHFGYQYRMVMARRGLTVNDIKKNDKLRLEIANIAAQEAQINTFRDYNKAAALISRRKAGLRRGAKDKSKLLVSRGLYGAGYAMAEGLLPFTTTPANILRRGVEYSPAGLVNGIYQTLFEVKQGKVTAGQAIDKITKGLTGTVIMALGAYFAAKGWVKGQSSDDNKQKTIDKLKGRQEYALQIGDTTYTIDWAAPSVMPFLVGANIYQDAMSNDGLTLSEIVDGILAMADTITDLSLLQGINSAIKAVRYNDNAITATAENLVTSYAGQYTPTLSGQIARTLDPVRRNAYFNDKTSKLPQWIQVFINQQRAKIPGVSQGVVPYVDAWGNIEKQSDNLAVRAAENFLSPGYISKINNDPVTNEVERLYKQTGDGACVPSVAEKTITKDGTKINLNGEQWVKYAQEKGQLSYAMAKKAITSSDYKSLSDKDKVEVLSKIYTYANEIAKNKTVNTELERTDKDKQILIDSGLNPATLFTRKSQADVDGNGYLNATEVFNYLESRDDIDLYQAMYMFDLLAPSNTKTNPYEVAYYGYDE